MKTSQKVQKSGICLHAIGLDFPKQQCVVRSAGSGEEGGGMAQGIVLLWTGCLIQYFSSSNCHDTLVAIWSSFFFEEKHAQISQNT